LQADDEARRLLRAYGGGELVVRGADGRARAKQRIETDHRRSITAA